MTNKPKYEIQISKINGRKYAVFANEDEAERSEDFKGCRLTCFGGYFNAYELPECEDQPTMTQRIMFAERSERSMRGGD